MLMISTVVNVVIFAQAYYLRAHKQEVFFVNSVVGAVSVTACTFVFGWYSGAQGIVVSCCIGNILGLLWATQKFQKYRRLWHGS
jgi:O-antigen/teichoic acid export membrane protein